MEGLQGAEINEAKKVLAFEATKLCRGEAAAAQAAETARQTFEEGAISAGLPTIDLPRAELNDGSLVYELLRAAKLASSNSEARRLIKGGGAKVNDRPVTDELHKIGPEDVSAEGVIKLSAGKKRHALVRPV